ncbi:hypothetical protein ACHAXT_006007 [Thalassiosira profunda]
MSSAASAGAMPDLQHTEDASGSESECPAVAATRDWAKKVPIGLGLCPWAVQSHGRGLLRIIACQCDTPMDAARFLEGEIEALTHRDVPPLSTTLVVCPKVEAFENFATFDEFVRSGARAHLNKQLLERVTLVAFHPNFLRWRGLPENIGEGSAVHSHFGRMGQKSEQPAAATVLETNNAAFGLRKVKVQFHETPPGQTRQEQFVPADWIVGEGAGEPLPDNAMHRSPHPTIHIIANGDLASLRLCDVSRVKRANARRMAGLGWKGLERRLGG